MVALVPLTSLHPVATWIRDASRLIPSHFANGSSCFIKPLLPLRGRESQAKIRIGLLVDMYQSSNHLEALKVSM